MAEAGPEESVVSLQDVLEEDQQLEQTANAVLGDSDDSQCTYTKVLVSCMTSTYRHMVTCGMDWPQYSVHALGYFLVDRFVQNLIMATL